MISKLCLLILLCHPFQSQTQFFGSSKLSGIVPKVADTIKNLTPEALKQVDSAWSSLNKASEYTNPAELAKRKEIFTKNFELVTQHGKDFLNGKYSFNVGLNDLSDLLLDEFNKFFNGYGSKKRSQVPKPDKIEKSTAASLPESVDWREKGAVTPVGYQNKCASCYAFSAADAIASHTFIKTNQLKELSPQNIMDCGQSKYAIWGCQGGYIDDSFNYVKDGGINILGQYPFEGKDGKCRFDGKSSAASTKGFVMIPEGDEKALEEAVATKGPVSVAIHAGLPKFQMYKSGVYYDEDCKNTADDVNHAVLVVGYGVENGKKYWLVKNSYGTTWGDQGYFKLTKDQGNHCGIATSAFYPIV